MDIISKGEGRVPGVTCVKKSGQIQPYAKQLRLGYTRFGLLG